MGKHRDLATRTPQQPSLPGAVGDLLHRARALEAFNEGRTLLVVLDGLGAAVTAGIKGDASIHFDCEITAWRLLADQAGDIVVDVWKSDFAGYPPTIADTITAGSLPTLTAADKAEDSSLPGWTTTISAGESLRVHVDSAATVTRVLLALALQRT